MNKLIIILFFFIIQKIEASTLGDFYVFNAKLIDAEESEAENLDEPFLDRLIKKYENLKTENSDHRDSYSSRPTLQCNLTRQLTLLENKVNKQEAVAEKCFEEMETLDAHY